MLAVREPARRETLRDRSGEVAERVPAGAVLRHVAQRRAAYLPLVAGLSLVLIWHMGNVVWAPTFLIPQLRHERGRGRRRAGADDPAFNSSGVVLAGTLSEWLARRGHRDANVRGAFIGALCALPFGVAATLAPERWLSLALLGPAFFSARCRSLSAPRRSPASRRTRCARRSPRSTCW